MARDIVKDLLAQAEQTKQDIKALQEQQAGIRDSLRGLAKSGTLSEQEVAVVEELYPLRSRREGAVEE